MLFLGEDELATHTVAAAALNLLVEFTKAKRGGSRVLDDALKSGVHELRIQMVLPTFSEELALEHREEVAAAIREMHIPDHELAKLKRWFFDHQRKPANFLKHADRDPSAVLDISKMGTAEVILFGCAIYGELGLALTPEMKLFGKWHLGVRPSAPEDVIEFSDGNKLHELSRDHQIEFGAFLLGKLRN
jgi:hypothetical protein